MSEKIELKVEVHSEDGDKESGEKETAVTEGNDAESSTNAKPAAQQDESDHAQKKAERPSEGSESEAAKKSDKVESRNAEVGKENSRDEETEEREGGKEDTEANKRGGSPPLIGTEETVTAPKDGPDDEEQQQSNDDVVQQQPTEMAESERVAPVCQLARAQASIQAKMRPGMWLPGVRNLHMAREVWEIKATPDECIDKLVAAVDAVPQEELMEVSKLDKTRHFVEIFAFTQNCNWLDVVEVTFATGEEPGTTRGEIVSFSSGLFPAWLPLSFICNSCCFCIPFSGNGQNTRRIGLIKDALQLDVTVKH